MATIAGRHCHGCEKWFSYVEPRKFWNLCDDCDPSVTTHDLKCWPEFFDAIQGRQKKFEVRKGNDREYKTGDRIRLREWDPEKKEYTGRQIDRWVTYVMHGGPFLPEDTWVFGFDAHRA